MKTEARDLHFLLFRLPRDAQGRRNAWLLAGSLLAILSALASLGLVATAGWLITASGLAGAAAALGTAVTLEIFAPGALIRFFAVARTVSRYLERLLVHESIFRVLARLRQRVFSLHADLPFRELLRLRDGPLLARLMADVERLEHFHAGLFIPLLAALSATSLLAIAVGLLTGAIAGLVLFAALLLALALLARFLMRQSGPEARLAYARARHRARLNDLLAARRELYFADPQARLAQRFATEADSLSARTAASELRSQQLDSLVQLVFALAVIGLVALAPRFSMDPAWLTLASLGLVAAAGLFPGLGPALSRWGGIRVALRRLLPSSVAPAQDSPGQPPAPQWTLTAVHLKRGLSDRPILDAVELNIDPGEQLLISGPSGTGKSRLARLLAGLEPVDGGQIRLAGRPLSEWSESERLACVGFLEQRSVILEGRLADNLRLGHPSLSDQALEEALQATGLADAGLKPGDWVGDSRRPLSGGEARRVCLIRTVLRPVPALILDEPFQGLDAGTRARTMAWLRRQCRGRTVIVLGHESEAVLEDQRELRLQDGRLEAPGRRE